MIIYGILGGLLLIVLVLFIRPITTTVHELGHAIPALLFTKKEVKIYIGSYGNIENSLNISLGRLQYIFKMNLLSWNIGMCRHEGNISLRQNLIIILGGPIASLIFGLSLLYFLIPSSSPTTQFILTLFIMSTILDFLVNIIPFKKPLRTFDGGATLNDGMQLKYIIQTRQYPADYFAAKDLFAAGRVKDATVLLEKLKGEGFQAKELYLLLTQIYFEEKNYTQAIESINQMRNKYQLSNTDLETLAWCFYEMGKKTEAIQLLTKAIELDFYSAFAFNNRGYIFNDIGYYKKAINDFNKAIYIDPNFALPFNNRGYANIMLGNLEEGLKDIKRSLEKDKTNAYAYRNLGLYFLKKEKFGEALEQLKKASQIDQHIPELEDYLQLAAENFNS